MALQRSSRREDQLTPKEDGEGREEADDFVGCKVRKSLELLPWLLSLGRSGSCKRGWMKMTGFKT